MKTSEFVKAISEKSGATQKTVKAVMAAATEVVSEVIPNDSVKALGVTFSTMITNPREGRNPSTGEIISIPSKRRVVCKPSKTLKDAVALD